LLGAGGDGGGGAGGGAAGGGGGGGAGGGQQYYLVLPDYFEWPAELQEGAARQRFVLLQETERPQTSLPVLSVQHVSTWGPFRQVNLGFYPGGRGTTGRSHQFLYQLTADGWIAVELVAGAAGGVSTFERQPASN
jgi:hypothetical protein